MSLEPSLKAALDSLVDGRVYPDTTPDNVVFPCIVYQQVGGEDIEFLEGTLPDQENARVQVIPWAKSRLEASTLARQIRVRLSDQLAATRLGAPVSLYEEPLKLYGARAFYSIWFAP